MINPKKKFDSGYLQPNGDIRWSSGQTSRPELSPCTACAITFEDYRNQKTELFKTDDPKKTIEKGFVSIAGDWYCHTGPKTGRTCMKWVSESVLTYKRLDSWGWLQPNGQVDLSKGKSIRLANDVCEERRRQKEEEEREAREYDADDYDAEYDSDDDY